MLDARHLLRLLYWPFAGEEQDRAFNWLCDQYEQPHRAYHNLMHIGVMLSIMNALIGEYNNDLSSVDRNKLAMAAWYHDAIYDPHRDDNEELSAERAAVDLTSFGWQPVAVERVQGLILTTKAHYAQEDDLLAAILNDADLSILSTTPEYYDEYATSIRQEYEWVPEATYQRERSHLLRNLLARPKIFATHIMAGAEAVARKNIEQEICQLEGIDELL